MIVNLKLNHFISKFSQFLLFYLSYVTFVWGVQPKQEDCTVLNAMGAYSPTSEQTFKGEKKGN